jgi:SAM-dependent methyltransferase
LTEVADHHRHITNEEWLEVLKRSVHVSEIDGIEFPKFPPAELQSMTVGSANEDALQEAYNFYKEVKEQAVRLGNPIGLDSKILDFGCSWGRYLRFFWRDTYAKNLLGVDIDPDVLKISADLKVPGVLSRIDPRGDLPFESSSLSHAFSYSVFTHLPENISLHWIKEIARVLKPGGVFVFTVEPPRFIDFVADIPVNAESAWHRGLRAALGNPDEARRKAARGELVYLPTGGGDYRAADVYGDAVIPESYARTKWSEYFEVAEYIDEPNRFWQAVVVARRR